MGYVVGDGKGQRLLVGSTCRIILSFAFFKTLLCFLHHHVHITKNIETLTTNHGTHVVVVEMYTLHNYETKAISTFIMGNVRRVVKPRFFHIFFEKNHVPVIRGKMKSHGVLGTRWFFYSSIHHYTPHTCG